MSYFWIFLISLFALIVNIVSISIVDFETINRGFQVMYMFSIAIFMYSSIFSGCFVLSKLDNK